MGERPISIALDRASQPRDGLLVGAKVQFGGACGQYPLKGRKRSATASRFVRISALRFHAENSLSNTTGARRGRLATWKMLPWEMSNSRVMLEAPLPDQRGRIGQLVGSQDRRAFPLPLVPPRMPGLPDRHDIGFGVTAHRGRNSCANRVRRGALGRRPNAHTLPSSPAASDAAALRACSVVN
jgi:hypothetical protein